MTSLRSAIAGRRARAASHVLAAAGLRDRARRLLPARRSRSRITRSTTASAIRSRLREGSRTVEVFVGHNRGGLAPAQRADVLAFAQTWRREATGGIVIEVPRGTQNRARGADAMREIRSILAAAGVPPQAVYVRGYQPVPNALASIRLNYSKMVAEAGPCGLWPDDLGPTLDGKDFENRPYWNLGCATQRNLAAMVDNPADLVQPRGETPTYTERRTVVLDKYRQGESRPAPIRLRHRQDQRRRKMIKHAYQAATAEDGTTPAAPTEAGDEHIAPAPRVSMQAFCETVETAAAVQAAGEDRRLVKAHVKIQMGGITAAVEAYRTSPTPNVILIERSTAPDEVLHGLDQLAEVCDAGTRVIVVGKSTTSRSIAS